jgi:hypothetical protein
MPKIARNYSAGGVFSLDEWARCLLDWDAPDLLNTVVE